MTRLPIIFIAALLIAGCSRISLNPDLLRADALTATDPRAALRLLDSLHYADLSETDRHFHDLLSVKAADKAYIAHTSDSLILDAAAYFKGTDRHPEALYYAGRVCSDLGDYPTALRYFQNALDSLPEGTQQADLRNCVLSQTGRLLNRLQMYREALPYLHESLKLTIARNDSIDLPYEYQLVGSVYFHLKDYDQAGNYFAKALESAHMHSDADKAFMQGYIAAAYYEKGMTDSALLMIRDVPQRVRTSDKDYFLSYAIGIYLKAEITDTAYLYAKQIIHSKTQNYQAVGYSAMIDHRMKKHVPSDSIATYTVRYRDLVRADYNKSLAEAATKQMAEHNYSIHERKSAEALRSRKKMVELVYCMLIILLISFVCIIMLRRSLSKKGKKQQAGSQKIQESDDQFDLSKRSEEMTPIELSSSGEALNKQIISEISRLKEKAYSAKSMTNDAVETLGYQKLKSALEDGHILLDDDPLWDTLMQSLYEISPDFEKTMMRFSGNKINTTELRYAVLIRFHFSSSQIAKLMGRRKNAIPYHRKLICSVVFHDQVSSKELPLILRLM